VASSDEDELQPLGLRARPLIQLEGLGSPYMPAARVKEVCHRLDDAGYRNVADLIQDRPPTGALLSRRQMVELRDVLDKWIDEANGEGLGDVVGAP
jgi:hypothetical protein